MSRPKRGLLYDLLPNGGWCDAFAIIYHGLINIYREFLRPGPVPQRRGIMVNASQRYGNTELMRNNALAVIML